MRWLLNTVLRAVLPLAALLACSPAPDLHRPEEPLGGKIYEEKVVVTGASEVNVVLLQRLSVTIPAAAYPAGTRVTLRIVDCRQPGDSPIALGRILGPDDWIDTSAALQILPASPAPAIPLPVRVQMPADVIGVPPGSTTDPLRIPSWGFDLLHARESDASFTTVAQDQDSTGSGADLSFAFTVAEPGLWTVAQWPLPASLQGRLVLEQNSAGTSVLPESIDLVGRSYTWARTDPQGCVSIETGILAAPVRDELEFRSVDGTTTSHSLYVETEGLWLDSNDFQLQPNNRTPLVVGCPPDAGHAYDGGVTDARGADAGQRG